jgi:hypothetical protein
MDIIFGVSKIFNICARVQAAEGRVYFVDERETMEERLREALGAR